MTGGTTKADAYTFDKVTAVDVVTGRECVLLSEAEAKKKQICSEIHLYTKRLICLIQTDQNAYSYFIVRYTKIPSEDEDYELLDIKLSHTVADY